MRAAAVPGFAVQHLVENAIRHGIVRRSEVGLVKRCRAPGGRRPSILVADDGSRIHSAAGAMPQGHGIENTRERLRVLHGVRASLLVEPAAAGGTCSLRFGIFAFVRSLESGAGVRQ